ncbi:MAG: lamin tail domain-containing protein [Ignavibacteria bacterium]|nr:lamin tail domain-containing protein [Ignavibacteria bacterium]
MKKLLIVWLLIASLADAQEVVPLYVESFDSVSVPLLPRGWIATSNRSGPGDFVSTTSNVHSPPNTILSTNATVSQSLVSPAIDFTDSKPERLEFYSARSSSHTAALLVEASLDDGTTFSLALSDTIRNPGTSSYVLTSLQLPPSCSNQARVRIRWRLIAAPAGGTTGTFRLDDLSITALAETPVTEPRALVINEFMFDPLLGQNEWIEFFHGGASPVEIARWKISDRPTASGSNTFTITNGSVVIQPQQFVLVAADSTILSQFSYLASPIPGVHLFILNRSNGFGMNNDGDDVILRDARGKAIDSVSYSSAWHHPDFAEAKGRSLERVNPEIASNDRRNWSTSPAASGGTPGKTNGIYTTILPSSASISIHPNPFSPDGDGFEEFCIIRYNLPLTTSVIRISIFDIKGRLVRSLANGELSGPQGEIIWDGLDNTKQRVRIGPYVVFVEAIDGQAGVVSTSKAVAVVAAKL